MQFTYPFYEIIYLYRCWAESSLKPPHISRITIAVTSTVDVAASTTVTTHSSLLSTPE